jgi:hypothetical protein
MRPILLLVPLALAACATPRERCIADATGQLRVINALVAETRGNISRGYAIEDRQDLRTIRARCDVTRADGTLGSTWCDRTQVVNREIPVAVDLTSERAKLDSLLERQALLERQSQVALQQCVATYPQ